MRRFPTFEGDADLVQLGGDEVGVEAGEFRRGRVVFVEDAQTAHGGGLECRGRAKVSKRGKQGGFGIVGAPSRRELLPLLFDARSRSSRRDGAPTSGRFIPGNPA